MAALVLILWERLSRRFTWWVLCRSLPYVATSTHRHLLLPRRRLVGWWIAVLFFLWPRQYRVFRGEVVCRYLGFDPEITPMPFDPEPAFLEAKLYAEKRRVGRMRRPAVRAHRDGYFKQRIKCSNGCGTGYGDALPGFFPTDAQLNDWTCVSHKCSLLEPHHCGRCDPELRGFFADDESEVGEQVAASSTVSC